MKSINLKTLLCVAGALGVSALGAGVQAQGTSLLSLEALGNVPGFTDSTATYTFTDSMIVNSIGFYTGGTTSLALSWARNAGEFTDVKSLTSSPDSDGFQWYALNQSFGNTETLKLRTSFSSVVKYRTLNEDNGQNLGLNVLLTDFREPVTNVNLDGGTNSNIRVSNPGFNVAPEPGSFALALNGGAALIGICIRRRRNAA